VSSLFKFEGDQIENTVAIIVVSSVRYRRNVFIEQLLSNGCICHTTFKVTSHSFSQYPANQLSHPVPGGYKYRDLALQVGGVSDETMKYGGEFCGTSTQE
jgi:hypothetical protein